MNGDKLFDVEWINEFYDIVNCREKHLGKHERSGEVKANLEQLAVL
jgi:hypothetical protein